ncbi:hypothetical protein [Aquimarina aquimarini]|uniref:hypothetical protein n=1 Tax=Aquimarina aquimarini TaxID=1191734 RepID=UPI000D5622C1|nr:hypothetical protein [Aquimarina aquimarini]
MKNSIIYFIALVISAITVSAQPDVSRKEHKALKKEFYESLSETQKEQLNNKRTLRKKQRAVMHDSFTEEQLAIVENEDLSRKGKRKALKSTWNKEQKGMLKKHRELMKSENEKFKATLTAVQLEQYESFKKKRHEKKKN